VSALRRGAWRRGIDSASATIERVNSKLAYAQTLEKESGQVLTRPD
jgi:hypothetical protein